MIPPTQPKRAPLRRVGTVTIGQSPRVDLTPDLQALLGPAVELVEEGALNNLSATEIAALGPGPGASVLVSRLRDGQEVVLAKAALPALIQAAIDRLSGQVELILLLCTGSLPHFKSACPILYPEELLFGLAGSLVGGTFRTLGVLTPAAAQVEEQAERWTKATGHTPQVVACSPYVTAGLEGRLTEAAGRLKALGAEVIIMDCLGYSQSMRRLVHEATGLPVLVARGVLGRVAAELLDPGIAATR